MYMLKSVDFNVSLNSDLKKSLLTGLMRARYPMREQWKKVRLTTS